jgi:hypothetical protein
VARSSLQPRSATPAASVRSVAQPWNSGDDFEVASSDRQAGQFLFVINRENRISVVGRRGLIGAGLLPRARNRPRQPQGRLGTSRRIPGRRSRHEVSVARSRYAISAMGGSRKPR